MRFYPISKWNNSNEVVKFAFASDTEGEAIRRAENGESYGDQKFSGTVIQIPDSMPIGQIWEEAASVARRQH